ncbi:MAG: beta-galactosidase [Parcubacteria group bacterium]|nr:beta-galactosidase [Parcubacteria group bacterium]
MKRLLAAILILLVGLAVFFVLPLKPAPNLNAKLGYTFSIHAANHLGLDWREAYNAALTELNPSVIRLPVYWDLIEPEDGVYDWSAFDEQLAKLDATDTTALLAIGFKLPRWPECHLPEWLDQSDVRLAELQLMEMLEEVVERYREHPSVFGWQVENEALFSFGDCPGWAGSRAMLKREIELVRLLDEGHPVFTSDSGELSFWLATSTLPIDGLAISLYRVVYHRTYFVWPVNPYFYRSRMWLARLKLPQIIISELQMEPWGPVPVQDLSVEEATRAFPPTDMADRFEYARRTGADTILAWGVEWWYYMQKNDHGEWWDEAARLFNP